MLVFVFNHVLNLVCIGNVALKRHTNLFEDLAVYIESIDYTEVEKTKSDQENRDYFQSSCSTGHTGYLER